MHWSHLETQILRMNYLLNEFIKEKKTMNIWRGHFQEFLSTSFNPKKHGFHSQLQSSRSPSHLKTQSEDIYGKNCGEWGGDRYYISMKLWRR